MIAGLLGVYDAVEDPRGSPLRHAARSSTGFLGRGSHHAGRCAPPSPVPPAARWPDSGLGVKEASRSRPACDGERDGRPRGLRPDH